MAKSRTQSPFISIFRIPELRKKVLITLLILIVYRLGSYVPVPGIDFRALQEMMNTNSGGFADFLNFFAGGGLKKFTIFALGIMPYITAEIIMQLLTAVIPGLEKLSKEGESGRKKIQLYSRIATIFITAVQAFTIMKVVLKPGTTGNDLFLINNEFYGYFLGITTIVTGTMFLIWLGDKINDYGIGNGISMIIFAGIVARLPGAFNEVYSQVKLKQLQMPILMVIAVIFFVVLIMVIYEQQGQRRIPIQYAKRVVGRKMYGGQPTYLPLKLNPSGVIPIIFSSTIVMFFGQIGQGLGWVWLARAMTPGSVWYLVIYTGMIIIFAFFYTSIMFSPIEIAENLKKSGGYIPGIRPGKNTEKYLDKILKRIVLPGSVFLAFIALVPTLSNSIFNLPASFAYLMGGTSLIIIVGVSLDTVMQIESQLTMHHYDGFMKKGRIRGRR